MTEKNHSHSLDQWIDKTAFVLRTRIDRSGSISSFFKKNWLDTYTSPIRMPMPMNRISIEWEWVFLDGCETSRSLRNDQFCRIDNRILALKDALHYRGTSFMWWRNWPHPSEIVETLGLKRLTVTFQMWGKLFRFHSKNISFNKRDFKKIFLFRGRWWAFRIIEGNCTNQYNCRHISDFLIQLLTSLLISRKW